METLTKPTTLSSETLSEQLFDMEVAQRLRQKNVKTLSDFEVRGAKSTIPAAVDPNDGWE